ncbi:MAG: metallophosphoesterase family protein [Bacteroidota bacterium]|jgi:putative phosphoesterase|nr:metallophosphoesterase family protein [Ignavibacteria bacterium]MCU7498675.1 metallophosphoesterase family protein [Ignavibacteria bacterium]MCU7512576.1 metallophosphoesterase family protein [Ignavibacteria bacterium]MCU7519225.1 metallophosphoesterase family protein [Ignavibacteria bacterium]MCU7524354.1 metallophosphoesterase family protein [Ignavibacteria bacterium]
MTLIGVISDTHGLLREEVKELFNGCALILHAGDVGRESVLEELRKIKDTVAVRGNVDYWADSLKEREYVTVENKRILVLHNIADLKTDPAENDIDVVIYGHSHKAMIKNEKGVLYFNPGSAGPQRFRLPITAGLLRIENGNMEAEIIQLK